MTPEYREILSETIYTAVKMFITKQEPFVLLLQNHNNWSSDLPERLASQEKFMIKIEEETLESSFVENDEVIINTRFGEDDYNIVLKPHDISAIMKNDMTEPIFYKPFIEYPKVEVKKSDGKRIFTEPSEDELRPSMDAFKKNNPALFEV